MSQVRQLPFVATQMDTVEGITPSQECNQNHGVRHIQLLKHSGKSQIACFANLIRNTVVCLMAVLTDVGSRRVKLPHTMEGVGGLNSFATMIINHGMRGRVIMGTKVWEES